MFTKIKTSKLLTNFGLFSMSLMAAVSSLEVSTHLKTQLSAILPVKSNLVMVTENAQQSNSMRRERDETSPIYISYNISQRTPSRSGRK